MVKRYGFMLCLRGNNKNDYLHILFVISHFTRMRFCFLKFAIVEAVYNINTNLDFSDLVNLFLH